jgi:hypothetical protein
MPGTPASQLPFGQVDALAGDAGVLRNNKLCGHMIFAAVVVGLAIFRVQLLHPQRHRGRSLQVSHLVGAESPC